MAVCACVSVNMKMFGQCWLSHPLVINLMDDKSCICDKWQLKQWTHTQRYTYNNNSKDRTRISVCMFVCVG